MLHQESQTTSGPSATPRDPSRPGDCFARCIAFIIGEDVETSTIPRPTASSVELASDLADTRLTTDYYVQLGRWIHDHGHHVVCVPMSTEDGWTSLHWDLRPVHPLVIAGGPREGDGLGHCVVLRGLPGQKGATVVFNPSESTLKTFEDLTFIIPIATEDEEAG